jgi:hypothetical protein
MLIVKFSLEKLLIWCIMQSDKATLRHCIRGKETRTMQVPKMSVPGLIFFPSMVIGAYMINKEIDLKGYITGGRLFVCSLVAGLISCIPIIGWIYGFSKKSEIEALREKLAR